LKRKRQLTPAEKQQQKFVERQKYKEQSLIWKELAAYGDIRSLAQTLHVSANTISKAINRGEGGIEILRQVDLFYAERIARKEVKSDTQKEILPPQPEVGKAMKIRAGNKNILPSKRKAK